MPTATEKIETRELKPDAWDDIERLFGRNGACGGCWCMYWRVPRGEKWEAVRGAKNRARFRKLVTTGCAHGVLAYIDGEPVGWCSFDRKPDYDRLARSPSLRTPDAADVWSIPCFFIKAGFRGRGVATALLAAAVRALEKRGARIVEGYPVKPSRGGGMIPAAFAWTGTRSLFARAGFAPVGSRSGGKQRVRLLLRAAGR